MSPTRRALPSLHGNRSSRVYCACLVMILHSFAANVMGESRRAWTDTRVAGPFVFHADFSLGRHESLAREMLSLHADVLQTLAIDSSRESVDIYLFAHEDTYHNYVQHYFDGVPKRRAMFIKQQSPGNVFAYENPQLAVDLRHECTHALLHASLPYVPLWLDEGLAEYFEVPAADRAANNGHLPAVKRHLRWRKPTSLRKLESLRSLKDMGYGEYRDAWAWVHFMLHGPPEARAELDRFLSEIASQAPAGRISERLNDRVSDLQQRFVDHFKRWGR